MRDDNVLMDVHTIRIPHAVVLFGKPFTMNLDMVFEHCFIGTEGKFRFKAKSLTGTTEDGTPYDMMHLVGEDEAPFADFIIATVHENQDAWDKEEDWWA